MNTAQKRPQSSALVVFVIIPIILALIGVKLLVANFPNGF